MLSKLAHFWPFFVVFLTFWGLPLKGNRCTKIVYSKYGCSVETNWIALSEGGHIWSQSPTFQFPTFYCDNKSDCTVLQKYWPVLSKCVRCYKRSWPSGPVWTGRSTSLVAARTRLDRKVNFSCSNSRIWRGPASIFGGPDSHFCYYSKTSEIEKLEILIRFDPLPT